MKPSDNEANMNNANLGSDGNNLQYDQVQGNRGAQKNPNRSQTLIFLIDKKNESEFIFGNYGIEQDFLNKIGGKTLTNEMLESRGFTLLGNNKAVIEKMFVVELLEKVGGGKDGADQHLDSLINKNYGDIYSSNIWLDGKHMLIEKEFSRVQLNRHVDTYFSPGDADYCPAIDGY